MLTDIKKDAMRRMKIIQGQVNKIAQMIQEEEYCPDILTQSLAVQNALKQVDAKLLEGHLKTCVKHQMQEGKTNKAVEELLQLFNLSKKNK
jgi:DNA-binding FrmR family transcriptional regulator